MQTAETGSPEFRGDTIANGIAALVILLPVATPAAAGEALETH
jgi:hypothetical protein